MSSAHQAERLAVRTEQGERASALLVLLWNQHHPAGTLVRYDPVGHDQTEDRVLVRTGGPAELVQGHAMVALEDIEGRRELVRCTPADELDLAQPACTRSVLQAGIDHLSILTRQDIGAFEALSHLAALWAASDLEGQHLTEAAMPLVLLTMQRHLRVVGRLALAPSIEDVHQADRLWRLLSSRGQVP